MSWCVKRVVWYLSPAVAAVLITGLLTIVSLFVGPGRGCEECGAAGASNAQDQQWFLTIGIAVAALVVACAVSAATVVTTGPDGPRVRAAPLVVVVVVSLLPVAGGVAAVAVSAYHAAHPEGVTRIPHTRR
jgi:uncharacterized protein (DUF983 family)